VNGDIAPKSIVVEAADPIPQWRRQNPGMRYGECPRNASGVRTAGMRPKDLMGTREIRQVQAFACKVRQAGKVRRA
jgi:hypothetical protein